MDMTWFDEMEARIPKNEVRTRFAPSPTGYMHVGNLRTALYTYLIARHNDGKFLLRIEDTDQGRLVEGAVDVIYKTMAECHLDHDEGPDVGGPVGPYVQTERRPFYGKYAELLVEKGHAYRCFCEKTESEEDTGDFNREANPCRFLTKEESDRRAAAGEPYVIRQRIPEEGTTTFHDEIFGDITVENATLDDQVLMKRDGLPTYNFANVVDDHLMGITHVVRGSEYLSSAPKYNLLYQGFGWDIPKYVHCSPVMRDAHNKMSKRHGDPSYEDLIAQGFLTEAVLNYVALLGWSPKGEQAEQEIFSLDELKDGALVAVPNDVTNEARALLLLADNGLITLADGVGLNATTNDIVENPKNLQFIEVEAAAVANLTSEVDIAAINGNYALDAGFSSAADAIAIEDPNSEAAQTYANLIVVKEGNEENPAVLALVEALQSEEVRQYINVTYEGNVLPIF